MDIKSDLKRELGAHIITNYLCSAITDVKEIYKNELSIIDFYGCLSDSLLTILDNFNKVPLQKEEYHNLLSESSKLVTSYLNSKENLNTVGLMYSPMITMRVVESVLKDSSLKAINKNNQTLTNEGTNEETKN